MSAETKSSAKRLTRAGITQPRAFGILVLTSALCSFGCHEDAPLDCSAAVPIVEPRSFQVVPLAEDPFELDAGVPDTGTATTSTNTIERGRCGPEATAVEDLGTSATFSIVTRDCSRLTVVAPLIQDVRPEETIELRIWHFPLLPYGPAEAQLRVGLEDEWLWSTVVPIPSQSKLLEAQFRSSRAVAAGQQLRWHVSNHGVNSWNWVSATVLRPVPCGAIDASAN